MYGPRSLFLVEFKLTLSFLSVEADGAKTPLEPIKATLEQIATVCYTSGTTSVPKGTRLYLMLFNHTLMPVIRRGHYSREPRIRSHWLPAWSCGPTLQLLHVLVFAPRP